MAGRAATMRPMAGTHIRIDVQSQAAAAALAQLQARGANPTELLHRLGEALLASTQSRFRSQTAPDGAAWAALSPAYLRSKRKQRNRILTLHGTLRASLRYQVSGQQLAVGTHMEYAAIHQFGGEIRARTARALRVGGGWRRSVKMPARPFLGLSAADERAIERTAATLLRI